MINELTPQQIKALDFSKSLSLKANAGSGKTLVLAKRYLHIALQTGIPLRRIAAITFTDKASGELYKRITEEIESEIASSSSDSQIKKLENIRRQLVSANISTIHSFCINILKEYPVEAEIDANFTPVDQKTVDELLELSIEETVIKSLEDVNNENCKSLIRLFGSKNNLLKQLRTMIINRKTVTLLYEEIYCNGKEDITNHFRQKFTEYFRKIFESRIEDTLVLLTEINKAILNENSENEIALASNRLLYELKTSNYVQKQIQLIKEIAQLVCTKNLSIRIKGYITPELRLKFEKEIIKIESFFNDLKYFFVPINNGQIDYQLAQTGKDIISLFNDTIQNFERKKQEKSFLDYEDILLKTRKLLQPGQAAKLLSKQYDYLMVDEYQDTNEIQYEIFLPILDYLKHGNLFVVGDEKQSIYRFREANIEVFAKTNLDIKRQSGSDYLMTLPDSFRMDPVICLFTNLLFNKLFADPERLFNEVEHSDLVCAKDEKSQGEVLILIPDTASDISEAELVTRQIINLICDVTKDVDWKDIAVLVRKRNTFKEIEKKFIERSIPFRLIGGRGFFQRQSISDIYNYFSFLLNTSNDAALVGILRSPFYSLSDLKIFEISLGRGSSFWEKLKNHAQKEERLKEIVSQLASNLKLSGSRDFSSQLRMILDETNYISVLAARPDGEQELANIEKLQRLANAFTTQGFKTLYDYVDFLKDAINSHEDEAQEGLTVRANAVNILTVHQAKGLEFKAVFLYKCNDTVRNDNVKSKSITVDKKFGILTKVPKEKNYFSEYNTSPVVSMRDYMEHKESIAETKRLFYVAVTRAKKYLYLSSKKQKSYSPSSFLGMLIDGLNINIDLEEHPIEGDLTYLVKQNNNYNNIRRPLKFNIQVIRDLELSQFSRPSEESYNENNTFILNEITDTGKGEIISASKVAVFLQCPLKYNLIYRYGYGQLLSEFKQDTQEEWLYDRENENKIEADSVNSTIKTAVHKGRLIHKILQKEIEADRIRQFIEEELSSNYFELLKDKEIKSSFINEIIEMITSFYKSNEFKNISSFSNYNNEAEIYFNEKDYFLYGIIDKLIIDDKKLIIVDYKTDDIVFEAIKERSGYYINQLNFYAILASRLYADFDQIETRLIFLKLPEETLKQMYKIDEIELIKKEITPAIDGILNLVNSKNLEHCRQCNFFVNNSCII